MTIQEYINNLNIQYKTGMAREHSYRSDLQVLLGTILDKLTVTNEPARVACGAPDFIITNKNKIPVGYLEAKNIEKNLKSKEYKEQFNRYLQSLDNIIFTDYLTFRWYSNGKLVAEVRIAETEKGKIIPIQDNFAKFTDIIKDFGVQVTQSITQPKTLAKMMAGKARLLASVIENAINSDEKTEQDSTIKAQMQAFKDVLIHDIKPKEFADIYAQTIAYGMFAARLHDNTLEDFSRQEAAELIPKSNPFLRKLFQYIAGYDLDDRIKWIIDALAEIFQATDISEMLKNFGSATAQNDPMIHFYETFLAEYDKKLRKARGVWYTPEPVVNFIVRAVDDILKREFDLPQGLADSSKTTLKIKGKEQEIHRVQILDPATGTGTFLAEIMKFIYNKKFKGQQGIWRQYVENNLKPRLNGFELLMASYAMAHLKLELLLKETGYDQAERTEQGNKDVERFRVYLTNSLEEHHPDSGTLFANWLSKEANEANSIKRDSPVMVVIGNPPYAISSSNKGEWIQNLIKNYKKGLNERKINIDDDYIKFIRYGQYFVEKNGEGILAYISNNSFIDGITHRQMRKHLLETFDKVYILDLHGNAKKKETTPDGNPDQNVFDIMQGVSINIFVKTGKKNKSQLGQVFHFDLYGKREHKYKTLFNNDYNSIKWQQLDYKEPYYFFVPKDFEGEEEYNKGFKIEELMKIYVAGIESIRDKITIHFNLIELEKVITDFYKLSKNEISSEYNTKDARDWKILKAKNDVIKNFDNKKIRQNINYRPFDTRKTFYTGKQNGFVCNSRYNVMRHLITLSNNIALITKRGFDEEKSAPVFLTNSISDRRFWSRPGMQGAESFFPLYLDPSQLTASHSIDFSKKTELEYRLKQAKKQLKEVEIYFNKTVQPFYNEINKPDKTITTLFEENKTNYEEAKSHVENLENQILELTKKPAIESENTLQRKPNFNMQIVEEIEDKLGMAFIPEKMEDACEITQNSTFAPIDILDYIYAVLHSPTYREKYKEFLKIDFPRVPYPKDKNTFWQLVKFGGELRQIHLLESPKVEQLITTYPVDGNNIVENRIAKKHFILNDDKTTGKLYINETQYFDKIPVVAYNFYIGGYQPAQKWLKDRKGRQLTFDDILHYQKIIVALTETARIMKEIDNIKFE